MPSTTFNPGTVIPSAWLNEVNTGVFTTLPAVSAVANAAVPSASLASAGGSALVGFQQSGTGAVNRKVQDELQERVAATQFGAKGDGVFDSSTAFTNAASKQAIIELPSGTFRANGVSLQNAGILGAGSLSTTLKANSNTYTLSLGWGAPNWSYRAISNITFDGNSKASAGIQFSAATSTEVAGRWSLSNVTFTACSKGVNKPNGNIGNVFTACNFTGNDFGYYAVGQASPMMHAGDDAFYHCNFDSNALAAVYIDSPIDGSGGTVLRDCIVQFNPGFGVFVNNFNTSYTPVVFDNVHFEGNHTSGSVTINSTPYTPVDIYLRNTARATITNGILPSVQLVNSRLTVDKSFVSADVGALNVDSTSYVVSDSCHFDGGSWKMLARNVAGAARALGNFVQSFWVEPRRVKSFTAPNGGTVLQSISYADGNSYTFTGTGTVTATTQADGVVFDSCAELTIPAGPYTVLQPAISVTSGRWYVVTIDVKSVSGDLTKLGFNFTGGGTIGTVSGLVATRWNTIAIIGKAASSFSSGLYLVNSDTGASQVIRLSALQIVEFTNERDALDYLNSGVLSLGGSRRRVTQSSSAPTTGTWAVGDQCTNIAVAVGQPKGWRCTVAGSPGTWVSEGNL